MNSERYQEMKTFLSFDATDIANLAAVAEVVKKHGKRITDEFYETLGATPKTAAVIEGRIDKLKATHTKWMLALVTDDFGDAWFDYQRHIGQVHVREDIPPFFVELTFSLLRTKVAQAIAHEVTDAERACHLAQSVIKALDMALALVNEAYGEERLDRLTKFTGFSRKLIENCINRRPRA